MWSRSRCLGLSMKRSLAHHCKKRPHSKTYSDFCQRHDYSALFRGDYTEASHSIDQINRHTIARASKQPDSRLGRLDSHRHRAALKAELLWWVTAGGLRRDNVHYVVPRAAPKRGSIVSSWPMIIGRRRTNKPTDGRTAASNRSMKHPLPSRPDRFLLCLPTHHVCSLRFPHLCCSMQSHVLFDRPPAKF